MGRGRAPGHCGESTRNRRVGSSRRLVPTAAVCVAGIVALGAFTLPSGGAQEASAFTSTVLEQGLVDVTGPNGDAQRVAVLIPRLPGGAAHPPGHRWPVVVALHGLGEAQRGVARGFLGWSVDYGLPSVYERMLTGHVNRATFGGLVRPAHLAAVNRWLATREFEGVAVVMPYTPAILAPTQGPEREAYAAWLAGPLLTAVRAAYPGLSTTAAGTGIDGISLGGRLSLEAGFRHPEAFGAVGGIQPAVRRDARFLTGLIQPEHPQRIRLLSSDDDNFLVATQTLSATLRARRVSHELLVVPGPHDYPFNRGPGSVELLRFAQTALQPEAVATPDSP